jgi:methylphosphotriester-DNA--protein-cysteine methyltransferase
MSLISNSEWDAFFTEQRFSWPDFKNRVRIRYALQELNSAYLATKTVESLSLELGFQSRKSFYTAFEAVTGESFRGEVYR